MKHFTSGSKVRERPGYQTTSTVSMSANGRILADGTYKKDQGKFKTLSPQRLI